MTTRALQDGPESFDVTLLEAMPPARTVLFAVGGGGDPRRHLPLLEVLVARGCTAIAPHFERLVSPEPTGQHLAARARRLSLALDAFAPPQCPVVGVGHSIGATMLLALAGGQMWMRDGSRLAIAPDARIERLALFAPATGFFRLPGVLDAIGVPIIAWAGSQDTITPPDQAELLQSAPGPGADVSIIEGAGHFSFMNSPPPHSIEPLADRDSFLADLAAQVARFAEGPA
jgi:pimeloyl-ACP methyl ester carboxylesterase